MGDKAGILPTELGMLTPLLWRDGDIVGTTLPPKAGIPPVAGLLGEICHCPGGGGVPKKNKNKSLFNYRTRYLTGNFLLKRKAIMTYTNPNTIKKCSSFFSIYNSITNISLYGLRRPKLNFGCFMTLETTF